jgi:hypothetical protein
VKRATIVTLFLFLAGCVQFIPSDVSHCTAAAREFQRLAQDEKIVGLHGMGKSVSFYVLRGKFLHPPYVPDVMVTVISNREEICFGDFTFGGVERRVVFSTDPSPVLLGDFCKTNNIWISCGEH